MDKPEARQYVRINRSLAVHYRILKSMMKSGASSKNISAGGICFPAFQNIQPGTILELEIDSEEISGHIKAVGEVKWIKDKADVRFPYEVGVVFTKIDPSDRNNLANYIRKMSQDGDSPKIDWLS